MPKPEQPKPEQPKPEQPKPEQPQPIFPELEWRHWLTTLFPNHFTGRFAVHHDDLWDWLWTIRLGDVPEPGAFIAIWPRGAGKSTNAEAACACFATRLTRRYGLYVSGTQAQADKHVQTVAAMLGADAVETHYPEAARRKVNKYGHSQGWRRNASTPSGQPTWEGQTLADCELELNRIGPAAFIAECQQEIHSATIGSVFPQYNEAYHVITWSEFAALYGEIARHDNGRPRIPRHWLIGRAQDWGTTIQHPCATVWLTRPGVKDPLKDSIFFYREMVFPEYPTPITTEVSPKKVGVAIIEAEREWQEYRRITMSLMSHEATAALNTYLNDMPPGHKLKFTKWKPDRLAGIAQLQNYLETTDAEKFELRLPEHLRRENYDKLAAQDRLNYDQARQTAFITYEYEKKQRQNQYVGWRQAIKNKYRDKGPWNP